MPDRSRSVSLRTSLLRSFVLLILLSSLIVLALTWVRALRTERRLSGRLIRRGMDEARRELDGFLSPAAQGTTMALAFGRSGNLALGGVTRGTVGEVAERQREEARRLNGLLLPFLTSFPVLSSVQVATERGEGFLVLQMPDGSVRNRIVNPEAWGTQTLWFDLGPDGRPGKAEWRDFEYDPRGRTWYVLAREAPTGAVRWTEAYRFATTKDLGITASGRWIADGVEHVVAFDVLLNALTAFTQDEGNRVSPNAISVIATHDGKALGLPIGAPAPTPGDPHALYLEPIDGLGSAPLRDALAVERPGGGEADAVFSFASGGQDWWAGWIDHRLDAQRHLRIGVLVPNEDLLEDVRQQRVFLLVATAVALLAALAYSVVLSRSYSRPLEALAAQSRRIRDLDFSSDERIQARLREFQELAQAQQQSMAALQSFSRYVPVGVVRQLVAAGEVARIGGRTETLTVLFTDIAGFTGIAEGMAPQALADHMATYFEALIDALQAEQGTVDKLVGDAIVAFWGAPRRLEDHAACAVRGVLAGRRALDGLRAGWRARGLPDLPTRFGLSSGPVVVGNIGAPSRLAYTVLGDTVNFASRLEGLNKVYGTSVLADDAVRHAAGEGFAWRRLDRVVVAGKTEPVTVHELLGEAVHVPAATLAGARTYEDAWDAYAARSFDRAVALLEGLLASAPEDGPARRLLAVARAFAATPPPSDWTATSQFLAK